MKRIVMLVVGAGLLVTSGCTTQREWYKNQSWTPDGFNYTAARDRKSGEWCDYWGMSWTLK